MKVGTFVEYQDGTPGIFLGSARATGYSRVYHLAEAVVVEWNNTAFSEKPDFPGFPLSPVYVINSPSKTGVWGIALGVLLGNIIAGALGWLVYAVSH
jgi:hypothetical protein